MANILLYSLKLYSSGRNQHSPTFNFINGLGLPAPLFLGGIYLTKPFNLFLPRILGFVQLLAKFFRHALGVLDFPSESFLFTLLFSGSHNASRYYLIKSLGGISKIFPRRSAFLIDPSFKILDTLCLDTPNCLDNQT
jgi:hypothetical protein